MNLRRSIIAALPFTFLFVAPVFAADFTSDIESGLVKGKAIQTEHFQIEFSNIILNQADSDGDGISDIIEIAAEAAEHSWDIIIDDMGYDAPITQGNLIIVLDDNYEYLDSGTLGLTTTLSNGDPYVMIDPWAANDLIEVTVGHEFFHAVQFSYDMNFAYSDQGSYWAEATASWMEDELFDYVNDYALYLPDFLNYTDYSIFASSVPSDTLYQYGLNIWPRFLSEYYNSDTIKNIWETYFDSNLAYEDDLKVYDAVKEVIENNGDELPEIFQDFTLWNLDLSRYEEGDTYPELSFIPDITEDEYTEIESNYAPALYGTNYLYFENQGGGDNFYFHIVKPDGVSYAVSLVPVDGRGYDSAHAVTTQVGLNDSMDYLSLSGISDGDGVVAIISSLEVDFGGDNTDVFDYGYVYDYLGSYQDSDEDFLALMGISEEAPASGEEESVQGKEGESAASNDGGIVQQSTFALSVLTYNEDSVTFSWKRLNYSNIAGYEINYGTEPGDYSETEVIKSVATTHSTISDLEEGVTYYFQLVGLDEDGDVVGDPSLEIAVVPAAWIFEDISYLDPNYDAIQALVDAGIFGGYPDGTFKSGKEINRAELLKILIEGRGIEVDESVYKNCFPDVRDEWFAKYVCYAEAAGWVQGYSDGTFRPSNAVNKVEALKILFKVYEEGLSEGSVAEVSYTDLNPNAWYAIYVWKAVDLGILEEGFGGEFFPELARTRGDMAEELYRYLVVTEALKD